MINDNLLCALLVALSGMTLSCSKSANDTDGNTHHDQGPGSNNDHHGRFDQLGISDSFCALRSSSTDPLPEMINTGSLNDPNDHDCDQVVVQPGDAEAPEICMLLRERIDIEQGTTIRATGTRALMLAAIDGFNIDGTVDVSAASGANGPGVIEGLAGQADAAVVGDTLVAAGSGGGGFGTPGGKGGDLKSQGGSPVRGTAAGRVYGNDALIPLLAGSSGGTQQLVKSSALDRFVPKQNAGGALALSSCGSMQLGSNAAVLALGDGGGVAPLMGQEEIAGGGGGGSGGGIWLAAEDIFFVEGARIIANGGSGSGGPQLEFINASTGSFKLGKSTPGNPGRADTEPAEGSEGVGASGRGGDGCSLSADAKAGEIQGDSPSDQRHSGGGGGGGCGRIRINVEDPQRLDLSAVIVSPAPSTGTILVP